MYELVLVLSWLNTVLAKNTPRVIRSGLVAHASWNINRVLKLVNIYVVLECWLLCFCLSARPFVRPGAHTRKNRIQALQFRVKHYSRD